MFINCDQDFEHWLFLFSEYFKVFVAIDTKIDGREEGPFDSPGQLNVKTKPHLAYITATVSSFSIFRSIFRSFGVLV